MKKLATVIIVVLVIFGLIYLHDHPLEAKQRAGEMIGSAATYAEQNITEEKVVNTIETGYSIGSALNETFGHLVQTLLERLGFTNSEEAQ